jgi:hypothetical protein
MTEGDTYSVRCDCCGAESDYSTARDARAEARRIHKAHLAGPFDTECAVCGKPTVGVFALCGDHGRYGGVDLEPALLATPPNELQETAQAIVDSEPAHDAAYWGLAEHPTIVGADCQQMAWARETLRAALDTKETL